LKIFSAEQIKAADAYTIKNEPIKSIELMERAAGRCFDWIYENAPKLFPPAITEEGQWQFHIVCGTGNNGGDGLAIARQLNRSGYNVSITILYYSDRESDDFKANYARLGPLKKSLAEVRQAADLPVFPADTVIIDAVFGIGLSRTVEGLAAQAIERMNASGAMIVSIDMPSGLFCDSNPAADLSKIIHSSHVLTFQNPKLSFFLAECAAVVGRVHVLDIGIHPDYISNTDTSYHLVDLHFAKALWKPRQRFDHKGTFGHALLIGGSDGKWGAISLSAKACMRAGAGLLTVHTGTAGAATVLHHVPEAMIRTDDAGHFGYLPALDKWTAIGAGPGMGTHEESARALKLLIQESKVPLVLDADALNILAENKTWLSFLPKGSILTPHPGEFARLVGEKMSHFDGMNKQRELSAKYGIYILLKGAHSSLSSPDGNVFINLTGNPGMATAGMGDVLTGIITGLLASGYTPHAAAALGMYVHGLAGDMAAQSQESLLATDLIETLGQAFNSLKNA
jgi:NAD(P)H-hydrate epimerase